MVVWRLITRAASRHLSPWPLRVMTVFPPTARLTVVRLYTHRSGCVPPGRSAGVSGACREGLTAAARLGQEKSVGGGGTVLVVGGVASSLC
jgi:hypothetical protein